MSTNTITIAGAFERKTWGVDYVRPQDSLLREAGGELVASSNDNGSYSHSPTDLWEFPDGSRLRVAYSDCGECRKWRVVIANTFTSKMPDLSGGRIDAQFCPVTPDIIKDYIEESGSFESFVGHADTAALFSSLLGLDVAHNRAAFKFEEGTVLFVGELSGGRLPEGATTMPEGVKISWVMVTIA